MNITVPRIKSVDDGSYIEIPTLEGFNTAADIQTHAGDIVLFLQSLRPLLNPTNNGNWTPQLGHFITVMVNEICKHVGRSLASHVLDGDRINAPTASVMEAAEKLTLRNHPKNARVGHVIFEGKVHVPTVRFLCSTLMVLVLEGLYGRNQVRGRHLGGLSPVMTSSAMMVMTLMMMRILTSPLLPAPSIHIHLPYTLTTIPCRISDSP